MAMSSLEVGKVLLVSPDGLLKLLNVLGTALPERCLSLPVPLLPFLRGRIDLTSWLALL
jgi:hypothetical protein